MSLDGVPYIGNYSASTSGLYALTAADGQKELQYITDSDTVIVLVTYDLKSNGVDEKAPVVNTNASLKDMDPDKDDSYTIKVCVANTSDDGTVADLIYHLCLPREPPASGVGR